MTYRCEAALVQDAHSLTRRYALPIFTQIHVLRPGGRGPAVGMLITFAASRPSHQFSEAVALYRVSPPLHLCSSLNRTPLLRDCHSGVLNWAQACDFHWSQGDSQHTIKQSIHIFEQCRASDQLVCDIQTSTKS